MRNTNRALNRLVLGVLGLLLVILGAAVFAAGQLPSAATTWTSTGTRATEQARQLLESAPLAGPLRSWWLVAGIAALLFCAALCLAWISRQGGGHTPVMGRQSDGIDGTTVIDSGLVSLAVQEALSDHRQVLATSVTAWEARRGTMLRVAIEARQGASPRELADTAEELVKEIDAWMGHPMPVLVRITSGGRSSLAKSRRTT
ncbi:hypothetical protein ACIPY3_14390 [Paenarthrobacter sp. NPDC089714]|uniref:hypothetical protein n=1 Tax=Paenarthrobacter sp. NPDC089714 TaxID=3364377 RepID=UPI003800B2B2